MCIYKERKRNKSQLQLYENAHAIERNWGTRKIRGVIYMYKVLMNALSAIIVITTEF